MPDHINGRALRIQAGDGASPEVFTSIAGAQEDSFSCETGEINITDKDDAGHRRLLGGGISSISLSISGVTYGHALFQKYLNKAIENYRVIWLGSGIVSDAQLECAFEIASYNETGSNENSAVTFTAELRSSGAPTYTAAVDA